MPKITPFLWFDDNAEAAVKFYTGIFKKSKITQITRYGKAGQENHRRKPGSVMTIAFTLDGQPFTAINGGPVFKFNEAVSFVVHCKTQSDVDYYWKKLGAGGPKQAQICGWLKDKFGVSWQIVPEVLFKLIGNPDSKKSERAMAAMMQMKKLDIKKLQKAYDGGK